MCFADIEDAPDVAEHEPLLAAETLPQELAGLSALATTSFRLRLSINDRDLRSFEFAKDVVTIGRDQSCDVHLDNLLVSRRHAEIRRHDDLFALVDTKAPNGCFVNGKRVKDFTILNSGDEIVITKFHFRFEADSAAPFSLPQVQGSLEGVGGNTLQMTNRTAQRVANEYGRVRGSVLLARFEDEAPYPIEEAFQIGADAECDVRIKGWFAPRKAALIVRGLGEYRIFNVSPKAKHVRLNGAELPDQAVLKTGDQIEVCGLPMRFRLTGSSAASGAAHQAKTKRCQSLAKSE